MSSELPVIHPDWPAAPQVRAFCTTRAGGVSSPPWDSLNLGDHVGDNHGDVLENRRRLTHWAHLETNSTGCSRFMAQTFCSCRPRSAWQMLPSPISGALPVLF